MRLSAPPSSTASGTVRLPAAARVRRAGRVLRAVVCQQGITRSGVNTWKTTNVLAVPELVAQGYAFVDLRDGWEAEKYGRYSAWANIPVAIMTDDGPKRNAYFLEQMKEMFPSPDTPLIIACDDGLLRTEIAAKELCYKGNYTQVNILEGGIEDYLYKYPVLDNSGPEAWGRTNAKAVHDLQAKGFTVVDVREGWEGDKYGRHQSWRNIPVAYMTDNGPERNMDFWDEIVANFYDPSTPLIIACDFGDFRSEMAAKACTEDLGFTQVYILEGGVEDYLEQFPLY